MSVILINTVVPKYSSFAPVSKDLFLLRVLILQYYNIIWRSGDTIWTYAQMCVPPEFSKGSGVKKEI
jgi:hypothetical protein